MDYWIDGSWLRMRVHGTAFGVVDCKLKIENCKLRIGEESGSSSRLWALLLFQCHGAVRLSEIRLAGSPHPCPLPWGEGELLAACLRRETGKIANCEFGYWCGLREVHFQRSIFIFLENRNTGTWTQTVQVGKISCLSGAYGICEF